MLNKFALVLAGRVKPDMEIITADGRRTGYVAEVASGEVISHTPARRIPLTWIRRVDDDVHISRRPHQLD